MAYFTGFTDYMAGYRRRWRAAKKSSGVNAPNDSQIGGVNAPRVEKPGLDGATFDPICPIGLREVRMGRSAPLQRRDRNFGKKLYGKVFNPAL